MEMGVVNWDLLKKTMSEVEDQNLKQTVVFYVIKTLNLVQIRQNASALMNWMNLWN